MKRLLHAFLAVALLSPWISFAQQTSCAQNLRLARATYEQGRLHEVPTYVQSCLQNGSTQEKVEAYKLLCLTYIYLEEPEKADEAMLSILRTDHYFTVNAASDPAEFIALYRTYRTDPIYRIGVKLGANATQPNVVSYVPANDGKSEYTPGITFQGGMAAEIPLNIFNIKGLTLAPELNFALKNFNYENSVTYSLSTGTPDEDESREYKTTSKERHGWVSIPLAIQYRFIESKLNPYVSLGLSADYLITAKNTFLRTKQGSSSLEEQTLDIKPERNSINISAIASLGGKLRMTGGYAVAEVRYSHGLSRVNDVENIYTLFDKTFPTSGYVDGVFKLSSVSVTFGYVYNIFNPKKLRR